MEINKEKNNEKSYETVLSFNSRELSNRVQRIVSALYMVSDLIDANDPIRNEIRGLSVRLSSMVEGLVIENISLAKKTITESQNYIDRIVNLLTVAVSIGFVSDMNFKIIFESLSFVRNDLNDKYGQLNALSTHASSFHNRAIQEFVLPKNITHDTQIKTPAVEKKQETIKTLETKDVIVQKKTQIIPQKHSVDTNTSSRVVHSQRDTKVLQIVKDKGPVSVGEVAQEFPETSEKTIQRILIKMLEEGIISKTGEKRWSRYFI